MGQSTSKVVHHKNSSEDSHAETPTVELPPVSNTAGDVGRDNIQTIIYTRDVNVYNLEPRLCAFFPPQLPCYHVTRKALEKRIEDELKSAKSKRRSLLLLWGLGSAGKTCLSTRAVKIAEELGYCPVLWLCANEVNPKDQRTDSLTSEIKKAVLAQQNALVIIDDAKDDTLLSIIPCGHFLVTSRYSNIGQHSLFDVERKALEVTGFHGDESKDLLKLMMDETQWKDFNRSSGLIDGVMALCKNAHFMPLSVNVIGSVVRDEYTRWKPRSLTDTDDASEATKKYMADVKRKLEKYSSEFEPLLVKHKGSNYPYPNVCAAIKYSIEILREDEKAVFYRLAVFDCGAGILPVTLCRVWSTDEDTVQDLLSLFCNKGILINDTNEYRLHDLVYDTLQILTSRKYCEEIAEEIITSYLSCDSHDKMQSISKHDNFYYTKVIRLCVKFGKADLATQCLCRLKYLLTRIEQFKAINLISDFSAVRTLKDGRILQSYEDVVKKAVSRTLKMQSSRLLLCAALLRCHDEELFLDAHSVACEKDDLYFKLRDSPIEMKSEAQPLLVSLQDVQEIAGNAVYQVMVHDFDERHLQIIMTIVYKGVSKTAFLFDLNLFQVIAKVEIENILMVKFMHGTERSCIVVTDDQVLWLDFTVEPDNELLHAHTRSDVTIKLNGRCLDAQWRNENLWILTHYSEQNLLYLYLPKNGKFVEGVMFECKERHVSPKVVVSECGKLATVSSRLFVQPGEISFPELFSVDGSALSRSKADLRGEVTDLSSSGRLVMTVKGAACVEFYHIHADGSSELISSVQESMLDYKNRFYFFPIGSGKLCLLNRLKCDCLVMPDMEKISLTQDARLPDAFVHWQNGRLFICYRDELRIYTLAPTIRCASVDALSKTCQVTGEREFLWLEWCEALCDFVFIETTTDMLDSPNSRVNFRTVLGDLHLLSDVETVVRKKSMSPVPEEYLPFQSVSRRHGRIAVVGPNSEVIEWDIDIRDGVVHSKERQCLNLQGRIHALCHSNVSSDLYVLLEESNYHVALYQYENGQIVSSTDVRNFAGRVRQMCICDTSKTVVIHQITAVLFVCTIGSDKPLFDGGDVCEVSLATYTNRLAVWSSSGLCIWELPESETQSEPNLIFSKQYYSHIDFINLSPSGCDLCISVAPFAMILGERSGWNSKRAWVSRVFRRLYFCSWSGDKVSFLVHDKKYIGLVNFRADKETWIGCVVATPLDDSEIMFSRLSPDKKYLVVLDYQRKIFVYQSVK